MSDAGPRPLWSRGFRPFFLLTGLYAFAGVIGWIAILGAGAGLSAPAWLGPALWHGHEMLFGVVAAAVAGFLLTSVPVWTKTPAVAGGRLAALAALWLAGRTVMLGAGALPDPVVALVDLAFLPALALALAAPLLRRGQARNQGFVPILLLLFACNLAMHAQALGATTTGAAAALRVGVDAVVVLIVVIGGRITPSFTANALRRSGIDAPLRSRAWLDRGAIVAVVGVAVLDAALPRSAWSGVAALLAALAVAARLAGWQSRRAMADPLLGSLHLGYAWVPLGLLLVGLADLTHAIPASAGLHGLTAGAMGSMILAVMTRVGLGHTGRALRAPRAAVVAYALVHAGALLRCAGPIFWPQAPLSYLVLSGGLWAGAFGVFVLAYAPILVRPRVDGHPD